MCVVIASNDKKAPMEWLVKGSEANKDGAGIAWLQGGKVQFFKSMDPKMIFDIYETIKPPYMVHFRIASVGEVGLKLCHPFPINQTASLIQGGTAEAVLMHNGTYRSWRDDCKDACMRLGVKFPGGVWSDTRAFAWLCSYYGNDFAELFDEKISILTPKGVKLYGSWMAEEDIAISNRSCIPYVYKAPTTMYTPPVGQGAFQSDCAVQGCWAGWIWDTRNQIDKPCPMCNFNGTQKPLMLE